MFCAISLMLYCVEKLVGAEGFEPPPADFFCRCPLEMRLRCRLRQVSAPVGHQLSANPRVVIPVQLEPAILPSYTIPPMEITMVRPSLVGVHAFYVAISSYAISTVDYRFSSKHVSLASW